MLHYILSADECSELSGLSDKEDGKYVNEELSAERERMVEKIIEEQVENFGLTIYY